MNELDREARGLIELARRAEHPTDADRARIRKRVAGALAVGAVGLAGHEAVDSGIRASLGPLRDSAPPSLSDGLGVVAERVSGEMVAAAGAKTAGLLAGTPLVAAHAVALLVAGAVIGGAATLGIKSALRPDAPASVAPALVQAPLAPTDSMASPPSSDRLDDSELEPRTRAERSPTETSTSNELPLVPQPEPPVAERQDLPEAVARSNRSTSSGARTTTRRPSAASPRAGISLADEARQLAEVQEALRAGDPARALARLDAMPSGGLLGEERLVARVLSLCGLGRTGEAEGLARQVQSVAPESPLLPRLRRSCARNGLSD